jgi:malic enzyme
MLSNTRQNSGRWSRGEQILHDPAHNKDLAFTHAERKRLSIEGLLPPAVLTIQQQVEMSMEHIFAKSDPLERYIGLIALLERNEVLFYRVLHEHLERLTPIIYTPTVGQACQQFSHIYRRPRGLFITPDDRGQIAQRLRSFRQRDIRLIVVTDNERILGLGDQGAGGMAIPIGKLVLYTAGAGIHPSRCLPISLDVGTDNSELLQDPFYLGFRGRRMRGAEYDSFIEEFVQAVKKVFPRALLQWEDFKKANAFRLLSRYVGRLPSFNDDIQGTASVTLAGVMTGLKITGTPLKEQRLLMVGSGAAGVGIGRLLRAAFMAEGLTEKEIRRHMIFVDSVGVVNTNRANLDAHKQEVALHPEDLQAFGLTDAVGVPLEQIVRAVKPTVLIGTTGQPGDFTPGVIRAMADHCQRPIIFPLSNPTSKAECTPSEAYEHSGGRALVATGSPFEPVTHGGCKYIIGQCNNCFIFPGIGLGVLISEATRVTDTMFLAAARELADFTAVHPAGEGSLYPNLRQLREVSRRIATRVAQTARDEHCGHSMDDEAIRTACDDFCWFPDYAPLHMDIAAEAAADRAANPNYAEGL